MDAPGHFVEAPQVTDHHQRQGDHRWHRQQGEEDPAGARFRACQQLAADQNGSGIADQREKQFEEETFVGHG